MVILMFFHHMERARLRLVFLNVTDCRKEEVNLSGNSKTFYFLNSFLSHSQRYLQYLEIVQNKQQQKTNKQDKQMYKEQLTEIVVFVVGQQDFLFNRTTDQGLSHNLKQNISL